MPALHALTWGLDSGERHSIRSRTAAITVVVIGNALEWYEVVIYGYLAAIIARLFFPAHDSNTSLLLAFASFGLTYVSRPLGAVVLGIYADRFGRKTALQLSICLMVLASAMIALVPTYATIGVAAPVIVVLSRLLQGFSVGGEFGSATAYLAEQDAHRRGYFASWQFASQGVTGLLATGFATGLTTLMSGEQIEAWGWRLPFLFGLLLYPVAIFIRMRLTETAEFRATENKDAGFRLDLHWRRLAMAIGLIVLGTVAVYTILFLPTYAVRSLHLPAAAGYAAGVVTSLIHVLLVPMFGALSDRIGRTPAPTVSALVLLVLIWPAFVWLNEAPSFERLLTLQVALGVATAGYLGAMPALLAELFPVRGRSTGLSISYAVGVAVFGGLAPLAHAWLIVRTGNPAAPALYVVAAAVVSLVTLFFVRRTDLSKP